MAAVKESPLGDPGCRWVQKLCDSLCTVQREILAANHVSGEEQRLFLSQGTGDPAYISLGLLLQLHFMALFPKHLFLKGAHGEAT